MGLGCLAKPAAIRAAWGLVLLLGCGDGGLAPPPDADVPPRDTAVPPPRVLELVSEPTKVLLPNETWAFQVRYEETDGTPIEGGTLTFGFEGEAHDTTLASFEAATNAEGLGGGIVVAGVTPAAFRIRVTADRAPAVYIDVAVSADGVGDIHATVEGDASPRTVTQRVISVFSTTCDDPGLGDLQATRPPVVLAEGESEASFTTLPPSIQYAVVVRAEGADGTTVGWGCVDATVRSDEITNVTVPLQPLPLDPEGVHEAALTVDAGEVAEPTAQALATRGSDFLEAVGGEGALFLDAMEAELQETDPDLADILALNRESSPGFLEGELEASLGAAGVGPSVSIAAAAQIVREELVGLRVTGPLTIDRAADDPTVWQPEQVAVGASLDTPAATIDVADLSPAVDATLGLTFLSATDQVELTSLGLTLPLGDVVFALLDASSSTSDGALATLVAESVGCVALADWVASTAQVAGLCDTACVEGTCSRVAMEVASGLRAVDPVLDTEHHSILIDTVSTPAAPLEESTGDLAVDHFGFDGLTGLWKPEGTTGGAPVGGRLDVTRMGDLP